MEITINIKAPELSQAIQALASALAEQPVIAITGGSKNAKVEEALVMVGATYDALEAAVTEKNQPTIPSVSPAPPVQAPTQPTLPMAGVPVNAPTTPQQAVTPTIPTTNPTYTMDQLAVAATQLVDAGRREELVQLLQQFGVQALTALPKEHYGAFATALRQMGAKI